MKELGIKAYNVTEWRVFIDCSEPSLQYVLVHNENLIGSVSIDHSGYLSEGYKDIRRVIDLLQYQIPNGSFV